MAAWLSREAEAEAASVAARASALNAQLAQLRLEATHFTAVSTSSNSTTERQTVHGHLNTVDWQTEMVEEELEEIVRAPLPGGEDPTLWLADELMVLILERAARRGCPCSAVCRRWWGLSQNEAIRWCLRAAWCDRYALPTANGPRLFKKPDKADDEGFDVLTDVRTHVGYVPLRKSLRQLRGRPCGAVPSGGDWPVRVTAVGFTDDGLAVCGSPANKVLVYAPDGDRPIHTIDTDGWVLGLAVLAGRVIIGTARGIQARSTSTWELQWSVEHSHLFTEYAMTAIAPQFVCVCTPKMNIKVMCAESEGCLLRTLTGHTENIHNLKPGVRGELVSQAADGTIRVWDVSRGVQLRILEHGSRVHCNLAVASDGTIFANALRSECIHVWLDRNRKSTRAIDAPEVSSLQLHLDKGWSTTSSGSRILSDSPILVATDSGEIYAVFYNGVILRW